MESVAFEHSKNLSKVHQNNKYFVKIQEAVNTMHSSFIGPRTEIGQEVHNIYKSKLLELAKDKELFLFVEQLLAESTELEQKYGSDVQSENSNNEKQVGRLDLKQLRLFQQENEATNDESSTKDYTQHEDSNKKLETSDSKTTSSMMLSNSNDSENYKSSR
ncbi:MAG: hypothetical protein IRF12RH_03355 [Rickettsia helvetica]|uniref:Uncharacterized protein n=1 Tax=Rickettsia helvetica TaxID=35789 RepID=A0ABP0T425_RICHE